MKNAKNRVNNDVRSNVGQRHLPASTPGTATPHSALIKNILHKKSFHKSGIIQISHRKREEK